MASLGSTRLNRHIICRQTSEQTGKITLLSPISPPCFKLRDCWSPSVSTLTTSWWSPVRHLPLTHVFGLPERTHADTGRTSKQHRKASVGQEDSNLKPLEDAETWKNSFFHQRLPSKMEKRDVFCHVRLINAGL